MHRDGVVAAAGRNTFIEPVCVVDAGHVAFNAETGLLRNINCATGNLQRLAGHTNWAEKAAFTPDGRVVSCSADGTVKVWLGAGGGSDRSETELIAR